MKLIIDDSAVKRIKQLRKQQGNDNLKLRITVDGGGCSGFLYKLELCDKQSKNDISFADAVVTDNISMAYLDGSTVFFEEGLVGSEFKIENPNATAGCGCGSSFSII